MGAPIVELVIPKGKTFEFALRYASGKQVSREVEGIPSLVPVRITVPNHGIPDGWPFKVDCVQRPFEVNGSYVATVVDPDTIEINDLIGQCWRHKYSGGGVIQYPLPADIDGGTARAMFRRTIRDEEPLLTFTTEPVADGLFLVDPAESTFTLSLTAERAETLPVVSGVWDAEAVDPDGRVYPLVGVSPFRVSNEVTR